MPKQIGWSNESNLLYQISQQITRLINVTGTNGGGGSITGSGTANYITRWTSSSSLNNSVIYQTSTGNIGIGTTTPSQKLDVNGNIIASYIIATNDLYGTNVRTNAIYPNSLTYLPFYSSASPFGEIMRVTNDGNVLIGTTTSSGYKLQVNGNGKVLSNFAIDTAGSSLETLLYFGYSFGQRLKIGYVSSGSPVLENNVQFGQIIFDDFGNFNLASRSNYQSGLIFYTTLNTTSGYSEAGRFENTGNFLIGTTTNTNNVKLKVNGRQEWSNVTFGTGVHTTSGNHLPVYVNNIPYWIPLLNPPA
jgi:hypothetical protein